MGFLIGRGGRARETYPSPPNAAAAAAANRNVAIPTTIAQTFTPATSPNASVIAAILYTPKVSGNIRVATNVTFGNGATADTFQTKALAITGTGLSVSGGSETSDGWVMGTNTPPVVGGTLSGGVNLGAAGVPVAAGAPGALLTYGTNPAPPFPIGVPIVIQLVMGEIGGGNSINSVQFIQLSVVEEP